MNKVLSLETIRRGAIQAPNKKGNNKGKSIKQ